MKFVLVLMLGTMNISADNPLKRIRRLAGGSEAPRGSFPYIVSLHDTNGPFCGGTIVSNSVILTAAHCTFHKSFLVRVGSSAALSGGAIHRVARIIRHERYEKSVIANNTYASNDLALIKVIPPITMTENVQKVQLFERYENLIEGSNATLIGWGATRMPQEGDFEMGNPWHAIKSIFIFYEKGHYYSEFLKQANFIIMSKKSCIEEFPYILMHNKFCAYSPNANGCLGDSGGPLLVKGRQAGIMSSGGRICANGRSRGVYVNVARYRDWIDQKIIMLDSIQEN